MEHTFELPVDYNNQELVFNTKLVLSGYLSQFHVLVDNVSLVFERDETSEYRVMNYSNDKNPTIDNAMLEAIIVSLKAITNV